MATDLQAARNALVSIAREAVGDRLSTIPGPNNTVKPAVLKSRKKFTENTPPFIILDLGTRRRQGLSTLRVQLVTGDFVEYETHYDYLFSYTVIGGDAFSIAGELEAAFREEPTRHTLEQDSIWVVTTDNIVASSDEFNGEFVEVATFNIIVTIPDVNQRDEGFFDTMSITGEIWESTDDPDPIIFNITV